MKTYEIIPIKELNAEIEIPGNKYIANRLLIIASLAKGKSILKNLPDNQDINNAINVIQKFGIKIEKNGNDLVIYGNGGELKTPNEEVNVGESGTFMRFITGFSTLIKGNVKITGENKIKERPIKELLDAFCDLGVNAKSLNDIYPPIEINSNGLAGGKIKIPGNISSQYISSILLVAPYANSDVEIEITIPLVSKKFVDLTIDCMEKFGVVVEEKEDYKKFIIKSGQRYKPKEYTIPSDWASASYFFALAAILPGSIKVMNLDLKSPQGESEFPDLLVNMGCMYRRNHKWLQITGLGNLRGINIDMSDMPDVVQTLTIVAAFCKGTTTIRNIEHLKYKESDRVKDTAEELKKLGIDVEYNENEIKITGGNISPTIIDSHNDHRMAMSFAIAGLKVPGIKITNPDCVSKSFPGFWNKLKEIGAEIKSV